MKKDLTAETFLLRSVEGNKDLTSSLKELWRRARTGFQWAQEGTTQQDEQHCRRVERNIGHLYLSTGSGNLCSPKNAYILSAAAALHDIGKIPLAPEMETRLASIRDHGRRGVALMKATREIQDLLKSKVYFEIVCHIMAIHSDGNFSKSSPKKSVDVEGDTVYPRSLAAIFRLGDMLETSDERAPTLIQSILGKRYKEHLGLWLARNAITGWELSDDDKDVVLLQLSEQMTTTSEARALRRLVRGTNEEITEEHRRELRNLRESVVRKSRKSSVSFRFPSKIDLDPQDRARVEELIGTGPSRTEYEISCLKINVASADDGGLVIRECYVMSSKAPKTVFRASPTVNAEGYQSDPVANDEFGALPLELKRASKGTARWVIKLGDRVPKASETKTIEITYRPVLSGSGGVLEVRSSPKYGPRMIMLDFVVRSDEILRIQGFKSDTKGTKVTITPPIEHSDLGGIRHSRWFLDQVMTGTGYSFSWLFPAAVSKKPSN